MKQDSKKLIHNYLFKKYKKAKDKHSFLYILDDIVNKIKMIFNIEKFYSDDLSPMKNDLKIKFNSKERKLKGFE